MSYLKWQKRSKCTYFTTLQLEKKASYKNGTFVSYTKKVTFFYNDLGVQDSNISIEAIETILSLFIYLFFLMKRFRAHKNTSHLEVYARVKNCCLCCLVLAYFCFVSSFSLVTCFCVREIFSSKKKKIIIINKINRIEILQIVSIYNTTPIGDAQNKKNFFLQNNKSRSLAFKNFWLYQNIIYFG